MDVAIQYQGTMGYKCNCISENLLMSELFPLEESASKISNT